MFFSSKRQDISSPSCRSYIQITNGAVILKMCKHTTKPYKARAHFSQQNKTKKWHFTVFRFSCGCLPFLFFSNKLNDWNTTPTYMKAPPQNRHCVWVEKNLINAVSISLVKTVLLWVINDILRLLSLFGYPTEIMFNLTDFIWKSIEECTRQTFRSDFWVVTGSLQATGNRWLSDHFTPPIFEVRFKTEQYFWTDSNVNVWLKEVTLIFPRMLEIKSQRVLNFKFFFRRTP